MLRGRGGNARARDAARDAARGRGSARRQAAAASENAVKTQIWCAVATCVLTAIVKQELHLEASPYTCLQILSVSVFEKTEIACALQPDRAPPATLLAANQLPLFDG